MAEQNRRKFTRKEFLTLLGLGSAVTALSCTQPEANLSIDQRFNLEPAQAKNYKKKIYLYNDFPNLGMSISSRFIEVLLADPNGAQIPDGTAIAVFFTRAQSSVQQRNNYLLEATETWNRDLVKDLGATPFRKALIVLYPEDYVTRNKNGAIDPRTNKDLSLAFTRTLKQEADRLSGKQTGQLPEDLSDDAAQSDPIRIQFQIRASF